MATQELLHLIHTMKHAQAFELLNLEINNHIWVFQCNNVVCSSQVVLWKINHHKFSIVLQLFMYERELNKA